LWDLANLYYHDPYQWFVIAEANDIADPRQLPVDVWLTIPQP
jgi:nucleoid-associated protein YgaU